MNTTNVQVLLTSAALFGGTINKISEAKAAEPKANTQPKLPNIVLILMDDMGYGDLACYGATQYETPNIDKLAIQGRRFTQYYAPQAVSSASRAGLLTGCYPNRVGITGALMPQAKIGLNPDEETIAEVLKTKGYHNMAIGKWHVGHQRKFLPLQNGFDEFFGLPYSNDMWPVTYDGQPIVVKDTTKSKTNVPNLPLMEGNEKIGEIRTLDDQGKLTTMYTEHAVKFIEQNKKGPFFLYLAHSMVHVPLGVSEKFKGKSKAGKFGDVMMEVDWSISQVLQALEKNGLDKNTIVIFTSDNGPWLKFGNHAGSAGGLREGKNTSWEGGQRVPFIVKWPGKIPAGTVCNQLACGIDILPTLASITGAALPAKKIDGVNILPLFTAEKGASPRRYLYYYFRANSLEAIQKDNWKLVFPHKFESYAALPGKDGHPGKQVPDSVKTIELYDLRRDPGERYNVASMYPDIVQELQIQANEAREDLGDDLNNMQGKNRRNPGIAQE
ncbi:MAG: sulfatase [Bacteroidota bacterium]|nr:sulfatase [Bacteroidota bacterium]